ncbi:Rmf/CrpP family protein [Flavobacterium sp.]|uniref:Rmf/CrpP family protein n=1 Tax=Flavobacterium sp. TaxID=239 RepID=UPI0026136D2B|nr:Rmf/CrpP family protein [Flavobacterium sp.]
MPSNILGSANAKNADIYCLSKAGTNSVGAPMEANGKFYYCSKITVLDEETATFRDSVAWIRDIRTESYVEGEAAARNGLSIKSCPYLEDSAEGIAWLNGYEGVPNVSPILIRAEYEK